MQSSFWLRKLGITAIVLMLAALSQPVSARECRTLTSPRAQSSSVEKACQKARTLLERRIVQLWRATGDRSWRIKTWWVYKRSPRTNQCIVKARVCNR